MKYRILLGLCLPLIALPVDLMAQTTSSTSSWSQESASKSAQEGCDDNVLKLIGQAQENQIQGETKMAHSIYDYLNQMKNDAKSCLQNMMPQAIFQKNSMFQSGSLWNMVGNQICSKLNEMADPTLNTINSGINKGTDAITGILYQNVTIGGGNLNLGTVPTGVQVNRGGSLFSNNAFSNIYDHITDQAGPNETAGSLLSPNSFSFNSY